MKVIFIINFNFAPVLGNVLKLDFSQDVFQVKKAVFSKKFQRLPGEGRIVMQDVEQ